MLSALWALGTLALTAAALWALQFPALLAAAFALGLCLPAANAALQAIAALAYPPATRATGMSWAASMGKLGPVLCGVLGGLMVKAGWSLSTVLFTLTAPTALCVLAALTLQHRHRPAPTPSRRAPPARPLPVPDQQ